MRYLVYMINPSQEPVPPLEPSTENISYPSTENVSYPPLSQDGNFIIHQVTERDTLAGLALRYNTS